MPCNHQEADFRMLLYFKHASENGHQKAMIKTVHTDVVILAVSTFNDLALSELWIPFGTKKVISIGLYLFTSWVYCLAQTQVVHCHCSTHLHDSTSQFFSIGKKTAWNVWKGFPELSETLLAINNEPNSFSIESEYMAILERFVFLLSIESCPATHVNQACKDLFSKGTKSLDATGIDWGWVMTEKNELVPFWDIPVRC